ncbi:MAG: CvpA family protein [Bacteroidales bacterium]|nr:CvpA family protein [Bacteroidales bacterium]
MNLIDFFVLIPLCWFGFKGLKNGLIYEITSILALVLGVCLAHRFAKGVALLMPNTIFAEQVAFIIIFIAVILLVNLAGKLMQKVIKLVIPESIDHIFGLLFGACKVLVVCSVLLFALQDIDRHEILLKKETKENSLTYKYVEPIMPKAMGWDKNTTEEAL